MAQSVDTSHLRGWRIVSEDTDCSHSKYWESIFTLGNGYLGVRGAYEEASVDGSNEPLTLIAEVYDDPPYVEHPERLAPAPNWLCITVDSGEGPLVFGKTKVLSQTRQLDMKRGTLTRHVRFEGEDGRITSVVTVRLVSMANPHIGAIAYSVIPENYSGEIRLTSMLDGAATYGDGLRQTDVTDRARADDYIALEVRTRQSGITIAEAARHQFVSRDGESEARVRLIEPEGAIGLEYSFAVELGRCYTLEKVVGLDTSLRESHPAASAIAHAVGAPDFARLEREHVSAWRAYWVDADIRIAGDRFVQTMARFFVFQLLQAASLHNVSMGLSASIPAKTMSGPGYNGHVFWDTEIYMLPFFSQQYPEIAKSLLNYRYDRLEMAKQNALEEKCAGARFPWESASSGVDTTPKDCATGWREIHVVSDVAFGCWQHYLTTGDDAFLLGPATEIILETARYWSTRAERKALPGAGYRYEITDVIGPDENHDAVDNSVFTNAMARWNIRKAMELLDQLSRERPEAYDAVVARHGITEPELGKWADVADNIKINFDPQTGLYEEFDGYFALQGRDRNIKQADVLLMLYLLPELRTVEVFRKNFEVYYPVTLHGSSLSPGVHVLFSLDIGYKDHAYNYEIMACSIDGTRRDGATDSGLHAASLGGGWSSIVAGFGGVRVMPDCLRVAPDLPKKWRSLGFSIRYRGLRLRFSFGQNNLRIDADAEGEPVPLEVLGERITIRPGETVQAAW